MPDEEADEDPMSEDVVEDDRLSETGNTASSCTSRSTLTQECRRSQEYIYPPGIEDDEVMATDERRRAHRSTLAFDSGRSNSMFSNLRSVTLSLRIRHKWFFADGSFITSCERCFSS